MFREVSSDPAINDNGFISERRPSKHKYGYIALVLELAKTAARMERIIYAQAYLLPHF